MATSTKERHIDELMEEASHRLGETKYFAAERLCEQAMRSARQERDFDRMARICLPLQEARRQRLQRALDTGKLKILATPLGEEVQTAPGCYLVQPPLVGADARRLRVTALSQEIPVAVICREPLTQLGQTPIVAIGQTTIRTKVDPPAKTDRPDLAWFIAAMEALGDAAIASVDTGIEAERQVDSLVACLDAHPDHEKLHQALAEACRRAALEARLKPPAVARAVCEEPPGEEFEDV
jgi:hypothetical protein